MKARFTLRYTISILVSLVISGPVLAQAIEEATGNDQEAEGALEEVIVTGSRLRRDSFDISTPLVVMENQAIEDTGLGSIADILVDQIPQVFESTSNTNSQSQVSGTGLSTLNLRRLGSNRTLSLIDGRRTVPNSYSGNYISFDTIPNAMIQRVEIITGGSSATYGSDAVAGVVNIITRTPSEGFGFRVRGGWTPEGGGEEYTIDADYGTLFSEGRGSFFIAATFDKQYGIEWGDRDRAAIESDYDYNTTLLCNEMNTEQGDQCMRDISQSEWRDRSDGTFGGVFEENKAVDGYWYDENNVLRDDWNEERDGINARIWDAIMVPNDRLSIASKLSFDFNPKTRGFFNIFYSRNTSFNFKSPEDEYEGNSVSLVDPITGEETRITPGSISIDNPFAPAEIAENAGSSISWDRRFIEVGNITTDNTRTTWRSWLGLQGSLFDDKWDWETTLGYGNFKQEQIRSNELDVRKERQALDSEYAEDGVTIQCADADARAAGCVPLNIFGYNSITPEMADWLRVNPTITTKLTQWDVIAYITGELFNMPAGGVGTVFGVEWRRDSLDLLPSHEQEFGGITFNVVPSFSGDIDILEGFTEASVPITDSFTADLSLRVADYSPPGIDTVWSYSAGLMWEVADGYSLRGNYARAQRAPTITELYSPPRGDYDNYTDICDGVTATSNEPGHDNCRLEPTISAVIAEDGVFEDNNTGYGPNAGNINLFEETADTWTLGFSIAPEFIRNFRLAVDYYDISIEDVIGSYENSVIMDQCYNSSAAWGESNPFCNDITRDNDGNIVEIMNRLYNLEELNTSGWDIAMNWMFELGGNGDLTFDLNYTHVTKYERTFLDNDGQQTVSWNNQLDYGIFQDVANASLTWRNGGWRVRWSTKYQGSIIDHQDRVDDYLDRFAVNDERCASGSSRCVTNPEVPDFLYYPSYWRHDLSLSYQWELSGGSDLRLFGGVKNVFDQNGPFIPRTGDTYERGIGNFDSKYGGGIGRFIFAGVEMRF
jgi:outer membrane receptor protein involved in Fe transport